MTLQKFFLFSQIVIMGLFSSHALYAQMPGEALLLEREYVIGTGDQLNIQVWKNTEFSGNYTVRSDGKISLPFLGDLQAARMTLSMFKASLHRQLAQYLKNPQITVAVNSSGTMQIQFTGIFFEVVQVPRGTTLRQILIQYLPTLQGSSTLPNLEAMKVRGVEKEYQVNGKDALEGKHLQANLRLEWGDEIVIPSTIPATPTPQVSLLISSDITSQILLSPEEFETFLERFPHARPILDPLVKLIDETIVLDIDVLSPEHKAQLGDEAYQTLLDYRIQEPVFSQFTDITLAGILSTTITLKAFFAFPDSVAEKGYKIQSFEEGEAVTDNIILEKILEEAHQVILRKEDQLQRLEVPQLQEQLGDISLSGILQIGTVKQALFANLKDPASKKMIKTRFQEGELIKNGIMLAEISTDWIRLEKGQQNQIIFLRDSVQQRHLTRKEGIQPIKIVLVGDSMVEDNPPERDQQGWGQYLTSFFDKHVTIVNHAMEGRSSKSFITEGLWEQTLAEQAEYILIQFGHNDDMNRGQGEFRTDSKTDFKQYLHQYIDDTRASGATPILITPISRFIFNEDGTLAIQKMTLPQYADAMKQVAREKNVALIDLHTYSLNLLKNLGKNGSQELRKNDQDDQHLSAKGAYVMAQFIVNELPGIVPNLKPYLKTEVLSKENPIEQKFQ